MDAGLGYPLVKQEGLFTLQSFPSFCGSHYFVVLLAVVISVGDVVTVDTNVDLISSLRREVDENFPVSGLIRSE